MKRPAPPANEDARVAALRAYGVLDTPPEQAFDDVTALAAHVAGTSIALISLIDTDRQWIKSAHGMQLVESPRELSFCSHVVEQPAPLVVGDTTRDVRFSDNPFVTGPPHLRFYAGFPLVDPRGHCLGTLCVLDDRPRELAPDSARMLEALARQVVSQFELRAATRAAKEATRNHTSFFALSLDMLCIAGFDGYFKELNPAWERVLGWTMDELKTRPFIDFVHPDDREATRVETEILASGARDTVAFENRYRHCDGSYRWFLWATTIDAEAGLLMAVARDITERKLDEEELRAAKNAADRANRTKSAFLANMSHELRTPLNSVIGFTNILLKNKAGNQRPQDLVYLERVVKNGKHLLALLNDVLDLSKIEVGHLDVDIQSVNLTELIPEVISQFEGQARAKNIGLYYLIPRVVGPLRADPRRLEQVLINLVGNAIKFTEVGQVEVRLICDPDTARPQRIDVIDSGVGIRADELDTIFEAFHQADGSIARRHGGTGLGLTISRSLCQRMGFSLHAASVEGVGSTFAIALVERETPIEHTPPTLSQSSGPPPSGLVAAVPTPKSDLATGSRRILIIDDDADSRIMLERYIADYGYTVVAADSGGAGLDIARTLRPNLITLDLNMPDMDGWSVLDALRADDELRDIPVIVCSVMGRDDRLARGHAVEVLDKPIERGRLKDALIRHLRPDSSVMLIVEDDPDTQEVLRHLAIECGATARTARNGHEALAMLETLEPNLIILDLGMPVMDGFAFLRALRKDPKHRGRPVVICTARELTRTESEHLLAHSAGILYKGALDEDDMRTLLAPFLRR